MVSEILGPKFRNNYSFLPADGISGGILIAASEDHFQLLSSSHSKFSLCEDSSPSGCLRVDTYQHLWATAGGRHDHFFEEVRSLLQAIQGEWLLCKDFNLIYKVEDKSNNKLNRRLMGRFKAVLDDLELRELPFHGCKFTRTNG
jgi:hypothetical protein